MSQFAKLIGYDEDDFFDLSFEACLEVIHKHGYELTGVGIVPRAKVKARGEVRH